MEPAIRYSSSNHHRKQQYEKMCNIWLMLDIANLERQNFSAHQLERLKRDKIQKESLILLISRFRLR